jgi:hypothetical protein
MLMSASLNVCAGSSARSPCTRHIAASYIGSNREIMRAVAPDQSGDDKDEG